MKDETIEIVAQDLNDAKQIVEKALCWAFSAHDNDNFGGTYFRHDSGEESYQLHINHDDENCTITPLASASAVILHAWMRYETPSLFHQLLSAGVPCRLLASNDE